MMIKLDVYVSSQTGCARDHNEDMVLAGRGLYRDEDWQVRNVRISGSDRYIVCVCDGMGGHLSGEIASQDVAEQIDKFFQNLPSHTKSRDLYARFSEWQQDEHEYLTDCGLDDPEQEGMGTTLVSWFIFKNHVYWVNCGDSRIYRFREDKLTQISTDHSLFQLTNRPEDEHVITNCMGGGAPEVYLDMYELTDDMKDGDIFVLCSDGLSDMLEDCEIEQILVDGGRATALTMAACEAGGLDNVSVCVVEYHK